MVSTFKNRGNDHILAQKQTMKIISILLLQLDAKTKEQLLAEIKTLAIVAQIHLVNIVRVRSLVQDRDEPIRAYISNKNYQNR